jgi:hypothetical protein
MKKSKLFMACGTLILAAATILATKANKKFSGIVTVHIGSDAGIAIHNPSAHHIFSNTSGSLSALKIEVYTGNHVALDNGTGNLSGALYTASSLVPNVYYQ